MQRPYSVITIKDPLSIRNYFIRMCEIPQIFVSLGIDIVLYYFRCCSIQHNRKNCKSLFHLLQAPVTELPETQASSQLPLLFFSCCHQLIQEASWLKNFQRERKARATGYEGKVVHETKLCKDPWWKVNPQWSCRHCVLAKHSGECIQEGHVFI